MKKNWIRIISIFSAISIMLVAGFVSSAVKDISIKKASYKNAYERLLAEEEFIYGVNLPWFGTSDTRTRTFGANAFKGTASIYNHDWVEQALTNIKAIGFTSVRTWVFTGWNGIELDSNGYAVALTDEFKTNFTDYLETVKKTGLTLNAVLVPHFYQSVDDIALGSQIVVNPEATKSYIDNVLNPFLEMIKPYEDYIVALDLYCEPEADTQEKAMLTQGTTMEVIETFISEEAKAVKAKLPDMPILVSAGQNHVVSDYNDLDLDIMGVDTYNNEGKAENIKDMNTIYPMWVTECGAKTDKGTTDEFNLNNVISFYESARNGGYKACYYWHYAGGIDLSLTKATDPSYLRMSATSLHFKILDYKYEREGIDPETIADKPVMLYSSSSDTVKWIGIRDAESYKLEMKIDNGDWQVVEEKLKPEYVDSGYNACSYSFGEMEKTGIYTFRVTATNYYDISAVSDEISYMVTGLSSITCAPEDNLVKNYSFEGAVDPVTGAPEYWQTNHADPAKFFGEIYHVENGSKEAGTTHSGEKFVHHYGGISGKVLFQNVDVKPNTEYTFTFFAKGIEYRSNNPIFKIIGVNSAGKWDTNFTGDISFKNYPEEGQDAKWTIYTLRFNSAQFETVSVYLYDGGAEIYLDDFYLFETPTEVQ